MRRLAAAVFSAILAGCAVNPLPEPPSIEGDVHGEVCEFCDGQAKLTGGPGSAAHADTVWAVNLDGSAPPSTVPVQPDGSFELIISANIGDELRVQARRDGLRSAPKDLVMSSGGVLQSAPRPLSACWALSPELGLPATAPTKTSTLTVRLEHTCGASLAVDAIVLRAPTTEYVVKAPPAPIVLAPGEFVDMQVNFTPSAAGLREEVLLIEVSSPAVDRRAVTLFGLGVP